MIHQQNKGSSYTVALKWKLYKPKKKLLFMAGKRQWKDEYMNDIQLIGT